MRNDPDLALATGDALLLVDVQCDFLPGGALAVAGGDQILPIVNEWIRRFTAAGLPVYATRDWHPPRHCSFAPQGPWPVHCVGGTAGAAFAAELRLPPGAVVVDKAREPQTDAYSGFSGTGLAATLREAGVRRLFVAGLATDFCVLRTVEDALGLGFAVVLIGDGVRAANVRVGDGEAAIAQMQGLGAQVVTTAASG
ncbi:MAG TPA: isochorismatase family protein [Ramlibacter sp.]|nr:isochorismatase family protein [Ramlibacter sp.]